MIMRLQCQCGRNLADVTVCVVAGEDYNRDWVWPINYYLRKHNRPAWRRDTAHLKVTPRPNVHQRDHHMRPNPQTGRLEVTRDRTYTWRCRCGQTPTRTAENIALAWDAAWTDPDAPWGQTKGVVRVVLDVDP